MNTKKATSSTETVSQLRDRVKALDNELASAETRIAHTYQLRDEARQATAIAVTAGENIKKQFEIERNERMAAEQYCRDALRDLFFAKGYIAALKGDPFPPETTRISGDANWNGAMDLRDFRK